MGITTRNDANRRRYGSIQEKFMVVLAIKVLYSKSWRDEIEEKPINYSFDGNTVCTDNTAAAGGVM